RRLRDGWLLRGGLTSRRSRCDRTWRFAGEPERRSGCLAESRTRGIRILGAAVLEHRLRHRRCLFGLDLEVEQEADGLFLDALHHPAEHVERLALIFDERVALPVGAQADALLQVVHLVKVFAPLTVEHREDHAALELAKHLASELFLTTLVGRQRVLHDLRAEELAAQP